MYEKDYLLKRYFNLFKKLISNTKVKIYSKMDASKLNFLQTVLKYSTANSVAEIPKQHEDIQKPAEFHQMDPEVILKFLPLCAEVYNIRS